MNPSLATSPHPTRIAIVCDWLIDFGGAELVIADLLEIYPDADIYTSVCYMDHPMLKWRRIFTSWIQRIPFFNKKHKLAGLLRPWAFRSFDLSAYDVIISSSSAEAKNVGYSKRKPWAQHFCYCHTPTRYYWSHAREYEDMMEFGFLDPLVKSVFRLVKWWMQRVDSAAAQKVDYFIANSETTAWRIQKYYHRESEVIYPWVDETAFFLTKEKRDFFLGISRCIPYKRLDLLVDAFNANKKNLILCTNTDNLLYRELVEKSEENIIWIFAPSSQEKSRLYSEARAFLFPPEEDFGLVPVEAMMSGTPVIAYGKWGATESVVDGETGIFFTPQTPEALNDAIKKFEEMAWNAEIIRARGMEFSKKKFQEKIANFIDIHAK